jgi:hypothetical protein
LLVGAHADVACATCHAGEIYKNVDSTCVGCHRLQDAHLGRYGPKCETCHDATKWSAIHFNHLTAAKFPLNGSHAKIKCDACHSGPLYGVKLSTTCVGCHRSADPHAGQLGARCESCHNETSWRRNIKFDHDQTPFPLLGRHAVALCEDCHRSFKFKDAPRACVSCHADQHHEGRLGSNCALCHNPNSWTRWTFNHNRQTKFPLTGAHTGLQCQSCHVSKNVTKVTAPTACIDCHRADDAHQGSYGRTCERCHVTSSFTRIIQRPQ